MNIPKDIIYVYGLIWFIMKKSAKRSFISAKIIWLCHALSDRVSPNPMAMTWVIPRRPRETLPVA
jgi:hypothetical protein